jgi:hypothetical protein
MPSGSVVKMTKKRRKKTKASNRVPLFCGKCGRIVYEDSDDYQWWLVGTGSGSSVIRCPQHITEWTMRIAGLPRSQASYRWKRLAKEQDNYDYSQMIYEPFFLDETW